MRRIAGPGSSSRLCLDGGRRAELTAFLLGHRPGLDVAGDRREQWLPASRAACRERVSSPWPLAASRRPSLSGWPPERRSPQGAAPAQLAVQLRKVSVVEAKRITGCSSGWSPRLASVGRPSVSRITPDLRRDSLLAAEMLGTVYGHSLELCVPSSDSASGGVADTPRALQSAPEDQIARQVGVEGSLASRSSALRPSDPPDPFEAGRRRETIRRSCLPDATNHQSRSDDRPLPCCIPSMPHQSSRSFCTRGR